MAKGQEFDFSKYDKRHLRNIARMAGEIEGFFSELNQKAVNAVINFGVKADNDDFDFFFGDFPAVNKIVGDALNEFREEFSSLIERGNEQAWLLSNEKNAELVKSLQKRAGWSDEMVSNLQKPNVDALQAFQERKVNGMNLSQRVWALTQQHKESLELAIECGLADGTNPQKLSRVVRKYLNEPNKLFRRVRDKKTGQLRLSKAAAAYHPGRGVYRSSYKNAIRMSGTETNMAYRTADFDKWKKIDFVIGVEVRLSPTNHTLNGVPFFDVCDQLAGTYPKDFKFVGWHPNCRCFAIPKLPSREEMRRRRMAVIDGGEKYEFRQVTEMPENFTSWIATNTDRIMRTKNPPYFIKDNFVGGDIAKGYRWLDAAEKREWREIGEESKTLTTLEKAAIRHAARTEEEIARIRRMAANREMLLEYNRGALAEELAWTRRYAKEFGVDISAFEKRFATEEWKWTDNLRRNIAGGIPDDIIKNFDKVYSRKEKFDDFLGEIRSLRFTAMNTSGAKAKALLKKLNPENYESIKPTFKVTELRTLKKGLKDELAGIKAHREEVQKMWEERRKNNLKANAGTTRFAISRTDKEAAEHLANENILSCVEWAMTKTDAEAELIIRNYCSSHNRIYEYFLRGKTPKEALIYEMSNLEKAVNVHLNKFKKFAQSGRFANLQEGVARKAEQFISDYYDMLESLDRYDILNTANGASNLVELIKHGADFKKTSFMMPYQLLPNGTWLDADITLDKSFFDRFKVFVPVDVRNDTNAYYTPGERRVHLGKVDTRYPSKRWRQQLVYHEFGHSQGDRFKIDFSTEVAGLLKKWRNKFGNWKDADMNYSAKNTKYTALSRADLKDKIGEERAEMASEWCAFSDIFGALHKSGTYQFYGGHSSKYWKGYGSSEAEFVAHCFEFSYIGNPVAKKYEPELYKEMMEIIEKLFKH